MDKNLDRELNEAQKDHKKYMDDYKKAKHKNEKLLEKLELLKQKNSALERSLKQQKKNIQHYTQVEQDTDKKLAAICQQQNKAALATAFSEKVLNEYRDKLSDNAIPSTSDIPTASQRERPSTSAAVHREELNTAIEDNRKKLLEIIEKIEDLKN